MCTVPKFTHYKDFPSELSQKRVPVLQLSTSGCYVHRLTVAAIIGAQYHLCLPLTPWLLLGLLGHRTQAAGETAAVETR